MNMKRGILGLLLLCMLAVLVPVGHASADVHDFVVHEFRGRYELFNDVHGGRMRVDETIRLTFSDQNHGILRALPKKYKGHSLRVKVLSVKRDGLAEPYTTYEEGGNEVLKIGNADQTITDKHLYEIQYDLQNIVSFYDDKDEWYWDINGDQWGQPFEEVTGEVIFPSGWKDEGLPPASCYTGPKGSSKNCTLEKTPRGYTFTTTQPLQPGHTLTVAVAAQKGLFAPRDLGDWVETNLWQLVGLATGLFLSLWCFKQWWHHGRDYKGKGVVIPEYEPPKRLAPAEVGLLMDYSMDGRDLTATIIDLAVRGYIRIHDMQKKRLGIFKQRDFSLELRKTGLSRLKSHEKQLLNALFDPLQKGATLRIADINRTNMSKTVQEIRTQLKSTLTKEYGLIEEKSPWLITKLIMLAVASIALLIFLGLPGWGWSVGLSLIAVSSIVCSLLMRRRSHAGVEAYRKVQGLKLYMNTAEKERLKMLQSVDRPYAEPAKTVELFEKLLPFAVALGVEKSWAKQFEGIYREPPGWYDGNVSAFHTAYFVSNLSSGVTALSTSFSQSTSSGSSGTGGGGFSGGGGGGGGGGGW